jgi:uncharacterized protein (DUF1800 family)
MSITWDRETAAHLARRAGFGATPAELDRYLQMGLDATVDFFVNFDAVDNGVMEAALIGLITAVPGARATYDLTSTTGVQRWFLHRMVFTARPLEEKITFFFNNHFTSGIAKVGDSMLIYNQNKTERSLAMGRFDDLVLAITKDPAMLIWLDNATNVKGRPNENYARELMELFTLGVDNYTQTDVTEVARALTGWTLTRADANSPYTFVFNAAQHDSGRKTILGQTGNWDATDALRIILDFTDGEGSVSGRFFARKLWSFFAYHDPPDWVVSDLANVWVSSSRSIRAMVGSIFRNPEFYEAHARKVLVRSPVEYIVASLKQLEAQSDLSTPANNLIPMGHYLFNPPDALGFPGDMTWINTGAIFARASFANAVISNRGKVGTYIDTAALLQGKKTGTPADVVNALADRFGLADAAPATRAVWEKYVDAKTDGSRGFWNNSASAIDQKVRGLMHLMLTTSDYHLC